MSDSKLLQFAPFASAFDAGFWYQLSDNKLNRYKLDDKPISICGFYTYGQASGMSPIANLDYTSFDEDLQVPPRAFPLHGILCNTNTLEEFKNKDKKEFIKEAGQEIWNSIKSDVALQNPAQLHRLACLTFADLKKFQFYYWVCFPAFGYPETICHSCSKIDSQLNSQQMQQLFTAYDSLSTCNKTAFMVNISDDGSIRVMSLREFDLQKDMSLKVMLAISDPSTLDAHPGWPLRNVLTLAAMKWGNQKKTWQILCFREHFKDGVRSCDRSIILNVEFQNVALPDDVPAVVGWEKNQSKLIPRMVNMSKAMDPTKLAEASVDLNLKLMKWRLVSDLDLDAVKNAKCLLLGSGTLGCNVARGLLAWGVRKITFVDNSTVSFSNPVRQTLFTFEDCLNGGKSKAMAAADGLKRIYPLIDCEGKNLSIPMPGHSLTSNTIDEVRNEVMQLESLIKSHDVVFLLLDTRESRWLPTLMAKANQKIVINAALGFETFLVMRHGVGGECEDAAGDMNDWQYMSGHNLGCYFCNDIVVPGNSVQDRTLDQQCTVTRPGVSFTAGALAVELMISILQHPQRGAAPAVTDYEHSKPDATTNLGIIPHQVRGYLHKFQNMLHISRTFDKCIACSDTVLEHYRKDGFDFLLKVFNDIDYLGEVTGLTELLNNVAVDDVLVMSDDESA